VSTVVTWDQSLPIDVRPTPTPTPPPIQ
jgi:hypothetical protein